jgi:hypothetical protein
MEMVMKIEPDALPIVKSSLEMKHKALEFILRQYRERLATFERTRQMSSEQFAKKFDAGELGDDAEWFEWEFVLDALGETQQQLKLLESVRL